MVPADGKKPAQGGLCYVSAVDWLFTYVDPITLGWLVAAVILARLYGTDDGPGK